MDISDEEYKKCKIRIKTWEHDFKKRENRIPTKEDIKAAPNSVKEAYKRYWLAKTLILEEAILGEEEIENVNNANFNAPPPAQPSQKESDAVADEKPEQIPKLNCDELQAESLPSGVLAKEPEKSFSDEFTNKDTVWGNHLKKVAVKGKDLKLRKSSSFEYTQKLFKGIKLKKKIKKSINLVESSEPANNPVSNTVDSQSSAPEFDTNSQNTNLEDSEETAFTFSGVKITTGKTMISAQPVNILHAADDLVNTRSIVKSKLNEGWLERCHQKCEFGTSATSRGAEKNFGVQKDDCVNSEASSGDDYVYSSEDESIAKVKNSFPRLVSQTNSLNTSDSAPVELQSAASPKMNQDCDMEQYSDSKKIADVNNKFSLLPDPVSEAVSKTKSKFRGRIIAKPNEQKRYGEELHKSPKKQKILSRTEEDNERKLRILREKVESGKANENYVRIDLKHKRYSRGKKSITSSKYKTNQWKMKKKYASSETSASAGDSVVLKCFRCGDVGHFMRQCKKKDTLLPLEECDDEDDSPFPTLEEAEHMVKERSTRNPEKTEVEQVLEIISELEQPEPEDADFLKAVPPLYELKEDGSVRDTPEEVFEALDKFGYENFRAGQEKAIMRILSGKSTLVISGTGSGKSLCYQLPAYLYAQKSKCVTLVISPLVSLMEDQVINFPASMKGACLHTNQTAQAREKIIKKIENNEISVLLVSPEAMVSGERGILGRALLNNFPPIAFVCIDEVHCVSQWSHNFRTSYLIICKILREKFNIRTFLGLTATASKGTISCIMEHLGVSNDAAGVLREDILPENLTLSVSKDESRDTALLTLLKQPPFVDYSSIIIYCLRRNECERLASFLRTALQNMKKPLPMYGDRGALSTDVEVYHAGLTAARRKKVQTNFMKGKLRIVVATVAFGMGINKSDIRGIIHYNMPRTFEHYVQEIGRAGRDGLPARCHLFFDPQGRDLPELKRHIHGDSLDRPTIRKLLQNVFPQCSCSGTCPKHEIAFSVDKTVRSLDLAQENISTLLCYLELLPEKIVEVLSPTYIMCTVVSYNGVMAFKRASKKCPPLAYAIAEHNRTKKSDLATKLEFSVIELADKIGWESGVIKSELKRCEWTKVNDKWKKTGIGVTFQDLGFHVRSPGNLSEAQLDGALDALYNRVVSQENTAIHQLQMCNIAFESVAYSSVEDSLASDDLGEHSGDLKQLIRCYFNEENESHSYKPVEVQLQDEDNVICSIHRLVSSYKDCTFTGRAVARIFHGIESPNYPAVIWGRSPFWRCALNEDFNAVCRLACRELIKMK